MFSSAATRDGPARPSPGGSSRHCSPSPIARPFQKGSGRLEMAQAIADRQKPADRTGPRQPGLALAFRQGAGRYAQRLRPAERPALAIPSCSTTWPAISSATAGRSRTASPNHALKHIPAAEHAAARRTAAPTRKTDCSGGSTASGSISSRCATRSWLSRASLGPDDRRARPPTDRRAAVLARRTVYGFIDRQNLDGLYRTFDFAVPDATSPRRFVTTVPQQALFLMNSPFLHEQARRLAASRSRRHTADDRDAAAIRRRRSPSLPPRPRAGRPSPTSLAWPRVCSPPDRRSNTAWKPASARPTQPKRPSSVPGSS